MFATIIKTQNAQPTGEYVETAVDVAKRMAEIRIIDVDGTFTVRTNLVLSGRGIVARTVSGTYEVTKSAMANLEKEYRVVSDF